MIAKNHLYYWN